MLLNAKSRTNLTGVHPNLVKCVLAAAETCPVEFRVIEGVRSLERQKELYAIGRTKPGRKVTWTLNSKHRIQADGTAHAVDLLPAPYDWKDTKPFDIVAKAMFDAAHKLGIEIRWGADWDEDGQPRERGETDSPHFEISA